MNKKPFRIQSTVLLRIVCTVICLCLCVTGCSIQKIRQVASDGYDRATNWSFLGIRKESQRYYTYTILVGTVSYAGSTGGAPLVVAAYSKDGKTRDIAHYTLLQEPGPYELAVTPGDYLIVCFVDKNGDLTYQSGEPIGQYRAKPISTSETGSLVLDLNLTLTQADEANIDFPPGTAVTSQPPEHLHYTSPGVVTTLDDAIFDPENGVQGYWHPMEFFKAFGGNIYFLEPYDPAKIPVLFVHGATGSPRGWQPLIAKMDRDRYQPWVFFYPSGASIKPMGDLLFWKLLNLKLRYHFPQLHLVAHSMGGLVVRSFLVDYSQMFPEIQTLTSIATPWGGDGMAGSGSQHSPVVLPAWNDMGPESEFFKSIYRRPLPPSVDAYLFFSHRGSHNLLRSNPFCRNNDGVIALSSQLDLRVQSEAMRIYGLDEDHDSILLSDTLASQINGIFDTYHAVQATGVNSALGKLNVRCSLADGSSNTDVWPWLLLRPVNGNDGKGILMRLCGMKNHRDLGSFPAGNYQVILFADAFRVAPVQAKVSIKPGKTASLAFVMTPDGWVGDYIGKKMHGDKQPPGAYLPLDEDVTIQSIRLTGNGVDRTLTPDPEKRVLSVFDLGFRPGMDWASSAAFCFYNLPQGEYSLTIEADGYEPYTARKLVIPGQAALPKGMELKPLEEP